MEELEKINSKISDLEVELEEIRSILKDDKRNKVLKGQEKTVIQELIELNTKKLNILNSLK